MTNADLQRYLIHRIDDRGGYDDLLKFPRYFEIETVNACNARCPMCTIADWERSAPTMKAPLFDKLAAEIIENQKYVKRVSLYRDGEPLLDKRLPDRISHLKTGGLDEVAISTNVSLLNKDRGKDILEAGIDTVILSIDSLKKDVFESIRAGLVLEEVLDNAQNFIHLRNKIRPQTVIWVRMIRQESNQDEWPEYEAYWKAKLASNDRVNYHNIHNWGSQLDGFKAIETSTEPKLPCVALWSLMPIFANGDVPLCNVDYNNKFSNGNVQESSIAELWQSKVMSQRRALHMSGNKSDISICDGCNVWDEPPDKKNVSADFI